jgi:hypothetical protein
MSIRMPSSFLKRLLRFVYEAVGFAQEPPFSPAASFCFDFAVSGTWVVGGASGELFIWDEF